jgi:hypothetical protein
MSFESSRVGAIALASLLTTLATGAGATTYTGARSFDGAKVSLVISTKNNVIGVLGNGDIASWDITVVDSGGSFELTELNSQIAVFGTDLTATPSALSFDFSGTDSGVLWEAATLGDGGPFYCVSSIGPCSGDVGPAAEAASSQYGEVPMAVALRSGDQVIATAPVPEPSAWTLLLTGFGGLGAAMRSRRRGAVATV